MACCNDVLVSDTRAQLADPTNTLTLRSQFERDLSGRLRTVRGIVSKTVGYENDALHLRQDAQLADPRENFPRLPPGQLTKEFTKWFNEVLRDEVLEPMEVAHIRRGEHWTAAYLRQAYGRGWMDATSQLRDVGVDVDTQDVSAVFGLPAAERQLERLYLRAYENLDGVTDSMAQTIREELTRGLDAGENPRVMARRLNGELDKLTNTRARTLARTEIINSHSDATLDRFERAGVSTVSHGEWSTAGDNRVCAICQSLEGKEFKIREFREGTFNFGADGEDVADHLAGTYRLKPPSHPNGRCSILPVV